MKKNYFFTLRSLTMESTEKDKILITTAPKDCFSCKVISGTVLLLSSVYVFTRGVSARLRSTKFTSALFGTSNYIFYFFNFRNSFSIRPTCFFDAKLVWRFLRFGALFFAKTFLTWPPRIFLCEFWKGLKRVFIFHE